MKRGLAIIAVVVLIGWLSGCSRMTALSDGTLALDLGRPVVREAEPLRAFDAVVSNTANKDASRSSANCAGGVCAIY